MGGGKKRERRIQDLKLVLLKVKDIERKEWWQC